jgi:hypothetical protein
MIRALKVWQTFRALSFNNNSPYAVMLKGGL